MKKTLFFVLALTINLLNGCGFKLKGQYDLAPELKTLYVKSDKKFNPLIKFLNIQLTRNNVNVIKSAEQGVTQIRLLPETFQRKTLSLFPNGQVAEYELLYQTRYQVIFPEQEPQEFEILLNREFQDDPNNSLAKDRERLMILNELRQTAADRILGQLITIQP